MRAISLSDTFAAPPIGITVPLVLSVKMIQMLVERGDLSESRS
jgi:hypothetical protein